MSECNETDTAMVAAMDEGSRNAGESPSRGSRNDVPVPGPVLLLGALGLLPFVVISAALWLAPTGRMLWLTGALTSYAAVILAFMGAVHWGLAMARADGQEARWYALGVLPALAGWCATLLPQPAGLCVLVVSFGGVFALDLAAIDAGRAPSWYRKLRQPLTTAVMASLALGATAIWLSGA